MPICLFANTPCLPTCRDEWAPRAMDEAALPTARITMALCVAYRMRGEQRENKGRRGAFVTTYARPRVGSGKGLVSLLEGEKARESPECSGQTGSHFSSALAPPARGAMRSGALPSLPDRQTGGCPSATACEAAAGAGGAG